MLVENEKLLYHYAVKDTSHPLPDTSNDFLKTSLKLKPEDLEGISFKESINSFLDVMNHKNETARVSEAELSRTAMIGSGGESVVFRGKWMHIDVASKFECLIFSQIFCL
jgi:hypothetical protein